MRILKSFAAFAAAILLCAPAMAADTPPDPAKVAAARAAADAAITRFGVGDYFDNTTVGELGRLQHRTSRLTCMVDPDSNDFSLTLNPGAAPGDDVTCVSTVVGRESWRAARYSSPPSLKEALDLAVFELKQHVDKLKPYRGPAMSATSELSKDVPLSTVRFVGRQDGKPVFVRVSVFVMNGWVYTETLVAPEGDAGPADLLGELELVVQIFEVLGVSDK